MTKPLRAPLAALVLPLGLLSGGCELMIAGPREEVADRWEKTYAVTPNATLEIENTNGSITVGTHRDATIRVTAHRKARAVSQQAARDLLGRLSLEQAATPDLVRLATPRSQGLTMGQQIEVRYEVLVPASVALSLSTVNGGVDVSDVTGAVTLETVNGSIDARAVTALRAAETVNGSVKLALAGLPSQGTQIETVNGGVRVSLPGRAAASVSVRTVNGGIDVDGFDAVTGEERRRRHYEGRLNGGGPSLRVETVNGGVSLSGTTAAATPAPSDGGAP